MRVTVRLFAMLRERAGWREREIQLADGATIDSAWQTLAADFPALASYRAVVRFARNGRYAPPDESLGEGDTLALIPPVAGGADEPPGDARFVRCELWDGPIDDGLLAELRRTVPTTADGALVVFVGQTRESAGTPAPGEEAEAARHVGKRVAGLEYEAFDDMATAVLHDIAAEIEDRFAVRRLAIVHRTGHVGLGEASVVICAAAAHRGAAFDAVRYAIEELKARAPIWKREQYADGSVWVGAPARPGPEPAGGTGGG